MIMSATQTGLSLSDEVFKRRLTDYEANSNCISASIGKNNNHIFLNSVSKLNLIFWANLGKTTPTLLNGPAIYFITSSTTYLNMVALTPYSKEIISIVIVDVYTYMTLARSR